MDAQNESLRLLGQLSGGFLMSSAASQVIWTQLPLVQLLTVQLDCSQTELEQVVLQLVSVQSLPAHEDLEHLVLQSQQRSGGQAIVLHPLRVQLVCLHFSVASQSG